MSIRTIAALAFIVLSCSSEADVGPRQIADPAFNPEVRSPLFSSGEGPVVCVDEAHFNIHTVAGTYAPFARIVGLDGYVVVPAGAKFSEASLLRCRVLVIANARSDAMADRGETLQSAFADSEIAAVLAWVERGGALFLIVDHAPAPAEAQKLSESLGVHFHNGVALIPNLNDALVFRRPRGLVPDHPISLGRSYDEQVDSVATFTGSAFRADSGAAPILVFGPEAVSLEVGPAGQVAPEAPRVAIEGWLQGAALRKGEGRVAVFGEAAMFSAQLISPERTKIGMNSPIASHNAQFLLNVMHWLTGVLD